MAQVDRGEDKGVIVPYSQFYFQMPGKAEEEVIVDPAIVGGEGTDYTLLILFIVVALMGSVCVLSAIKPRDSNEEPTIVYRIMSPIRNFINNRLRRNQQRDREDIR